MSAVANRSLPLRLGSQRTSSLKEKPTEINNQLVKRVSLKFDTEIVFSLALSYAGLDSTVGIQCCPNLTSLNISHNQLTELQGLSTLTQLRRLDISHNTISSLDGLAGWVGLESIKAEGNKIANMNSLRLSELACLPQLQTLYLRELDGSNANPVCSQASYKQHVVSTLPGITNLDGERCPRTSAYMEVAGEVQAARLRPPAAKQYTLPVPGPFFDSMAMKSVMQQISNQLIPATDVGSQKLLVCAAEADSNEGSSGSGGGGGGSSTCSAVRPSSAVKDNSQMLATNGLQADSSDAVLAGPAVVNLVRCIDECRMLGEVLDQQVHHLVSAAKHAS
eukprot:jgi/Chrzof1/153/Cz01g05100.t1